MCQIRTQTQSGSRKSSLVVGKTSTNTTVDRPRKLQFSTIEVREYNRTLGDNPACTCGPPTQLDWDYAVTCNTTLDEYEKKALMADVVV